MKLFRESPPNLESNVRFIHAVGNAPSVDIYINGSMIVEDISFSKVSQYSKLLSGNYEIQIYNTGVYGTPLLSQNISFFSGSNYTISIVTLDNQLFLFRLRDNDIPITNESTFLRFINLSPNSPLLSLDLDTNVGLFNDVEYIETTGYYPMSAGIYNFKLIVVPYETISKNIRNITLEPEKFYTIYILGLYSSTPPLGYLFLEDMKV